MSNDIIQGFLSIVSDDSSDYPQATAEYRGKPTDVVRHSVYGVCSNPPKESLGLLFKVSGMNGVRYGTFDYIQGRFKNLDEGEVQMGNYLTTASIKFDKDGNVILDVPSGGQLTVNSENSIFNGDVIVNGTISANDFESLTSGFNFSTHIHTGDSGGSTSAPIA